jgi:hypothetical protein
MKDEHRASRGERRAENKTGVVHTKPTREEAKRRIKDLMESLK